MSGPKAGRGQGHVCSLSDKSVRQQTYSLSIGYILFAIIPLQILKHFSFRRLELHITETMARFQSVSFVMLMLASVQVKQTVTGQTYQITSRP